MTKKENEKGWLMADGEGYYRLYVARGDELVEVQEYVPTNAYGPARVRASKLGIETD